MSQIPKNEKREKMIAEMDSVLKHVSKGILSYEEIPKPRLERILAIEHLEMIILEEASSPTSSFEPHMEAVEGSVSKCDPFDVSYIIFKACNAGSYDFLKSCLEKFPIFKEQIKSTFVGFSYLYHTCSPHWKEVRSKEGQTKVIRLLLEMPDFSFDYKKDQKGDPENLACLHHLVSGGNYDAYKLLCEHPGVNSLALDDRKMTALEVAFWAKRDNFKLYEKHGNIFFEECKRLPYDELSKHFSTRAWKEARTSLDLDKIEEKFPLLSTINTLDSSEEAISHGLEEVASMPDDERGDRNWIIGLCLIYVGSDVNDKAIRLMLKNAVFRRHIFDPKQPDVLRTVMCNYSEDKEKLKRALNVVKLFFDDKSTDVNNRDGHGETILHQAARSGVWEMYQLIDRHPDIDKNIRNKDGDCEKTSLELAYRQSKDFILMYHVEEYGMEETRRYFSDQETKDKMTETIERLMKAVWLPGRDRYRKN